jgi:hemolysin activation/secretion protein
MNIKKLCQVIVLKSQFAVFLPLIFISALFWVFSSIYGLTETIDTGGALKNSFKPPAKNLTSKNTLPMFEAPPVERFNPQEAGAKVFIRNIKFLNNTIFTRREILTVIGGVPSRSFSLTELFKLADKISRHYRNQGYFLARAIIPNQKIKNNTVSIVILEGQYGKIYSEGDAAYGPQVMAYLSDLKTDAVIRSDPLIRKIGVISQLPGFETEYTLSPGAKIGQSDLRVKIEPTSHAFGSLNLANDGSRFFGKNRGRVDITLIPEVIFGDQINMTLMKTSETFYLGRIGYARPIGHDGGRVKVEMSRSTYDLSGQFDPLEGHTTGYLAEVSYPLLIGNKKETDAVLRVQRDEIVEMLAGAKFEKRVNEKFEFGISFEQKQSLLKASRRFGQITVATTNVSSDRAGAAQGRAVILSGNIEQHQRIARSSVLKSRLLFQAASRQNLNSLEGFSLGGAHSIRAYPVGEASGSNGFLGQFELYESLNAASAAYLFLDYGQVTENAGENTRRLAGVGLGVQFSNKRLSLDLSLAQRLSMAASSVDPSNRDPQFWTSVNINF